MKLIALAHTQHLAIGVRLPTDCGLVLPGGAFEPRILAWRGVGGRLICHLHPGCGPEALPNQPRTQLPNIRRGLSPLYFPL